MSDDEYRFPLNPPLVVSGAVDPLSMNVEPFNFTDGLAVAMHGGSDPDDDALLLMFYIVIMTDGRVYEVCDRNITSARPWEPGTYVPRPNPIKPDAPDSVRDILPETEN